jgi:ribosomal protein L21E
MDLSEIWTITEATIGNMMERKYRGRIGREVKKSKKPTSLLNLSWRRRYKIRTSCQRKQRTRVSLHLSKSVNEYKECKVYPCRINNNKMREGKD